MLEQPSEHKGELRGPYLKMPPETLLLRANGQNIAVDRAELVRAQWFWERRPKKFILSTEKAIIILTLYAIFWAATICLIPGWPAMAVLPAVGYVILTALPVWSYLDARRYARWSSDYRCAIFKLVKTARR
jgi:hypothetical protein